MRLPKQAVPVKRPDVIYPHRSVDVVHGTAEQLVAIRIKLLHGANYNDPPYFPQVGYSQMMSSCWGGGCMSSF